MVGTPPVAGSGSEVVEGAGPRMPSRARRTIGGTDHRREQAGRREVRDRVEPEREGGRAAEEQHEQAGERVVDDVGDRLADPHRGVRRQQVGRRRRAEGRIAIRAGRKKIETVVIRNTTTYASQTLIEIVTGTSSTSDARRMSDTTRTCFWSQRSTRAPATGENSRFGRLPATNTSATWSGDFVVSNTKYRSASWFTRSPNMLISWPTHSAENEPLSASRTYGWRRIRVRTDARRRGIASIDVVDERAVREAGVGRAPAWPVLVEPRRSGRSSAAVSSSAGLRPVLAGIGAPGAVGRIPVPGARSRAVPATPSSRSSRASSSARCASAGERRRVANRKKPRPALRNRSPIEATFWSGGIGSGMTSASGPRRRKNSAFTSYSGMWRTEFRGPSGRRTRRRPSRPASGRR